VCDSVCVCARVCMCVCARVCMCVCVCVFRGWFVYQVNTGWVGLDGMWESLCVCCVCIGGVGGAEGKRGWGLDTGVFMKNRPI
jgi:hypothetical protein